MIRIKFLLLIILFLSPMSLLAKSGSSDTGLFYSSWGNVDKAVVGINHIALLTAEPGSYNDCTLTLTDSSITKANL
jgi:hypothetical protein